MANLSIQWPKNKRFAAVVETIEFEWQSFFRRLGERASALPEFTVATVPSAADNPRMMIYVSIGAAGSIFGGNSAAKAQKKAAQLEAQNQAANRELLRPAIEGGDQARGALLNAFGLNGREAQTKYADEFQTDPGFQKSVDYGLSNIDARVGALGSRRSGNTLAALSDFGQRSMYDAFNDRLGRLQALASGGQAQAGQLAGLNTASTVSQAGNIANAGYYQGAGMSNAANAVGSGLNTYGVLKAYQSPVRGGVM